jgi:hypothetical protein
VTVTSYRMKERDSFLVRFLSTFTHKKDGSWFLGLLFSL